MIGYAHEEEQEREQCPPERIVFDESSGQYICISEDGTAYVIEQVLDQGPEWRAFDAEERARKSRTGGPVSPESGSAGVSSMIDWRDRDASGRKLSPERRAEASRLRRWQIRAKVPDSLERNLQQAKDILNVLAFKMGLIQVIKERALQIYREALEKGVTKGRAVEPLIAAAIYAACRIERLPRTLDEIASYTKASKKEIARCYRHLVKELKLKVPVADPRDYVHKIAATLGLGGKVVSKAIEIVTEAKKAGIVAGKDPAGLAAAAVYLAAQIYGEERTQKEVAVAAGVTEVTVRNRYKELIQHLKIRPPTS